MRKHELLKLLSLEDPFTGVVVDPKATLWGWPGGDSPIFSELIQTVRPRTIIEVGTWLGLSTYTMSRALTATGITDACIIAVDTWLGGEEHWSTDEGRESLGFVHGRPTIYERFLSNMVREGFASTILPLPLSSLIAGRLLKKSGITADLIYLDGSHHEKDVYDDLCVYGELLTEKGAIFGDDFQWESVAAAVTRYAAEHNLEIGRADKFWTLRPRKDAPVVLSELPRTATYQEPELTYLVLDYHKEGETRRCLESIKQFTKIPHKVVYLHNGSDVAYPRTFLEEGLVDTFVMTKENNGLGIGTRDLFGLSFGEYALYLQNDQYLIHDITSEVWRNLTSLLGKQFRSRDDDSVWTVASVDIAGGHWGWHRYNERAHIMRSEFYKQMEREIPLGPFGAGPWHDGFWREGQIQKHYEDHKLMHYTYEHILIADNGGRAVRENLDGSIWETDKATGGVSLIKGPVREQFVHPPFSDKEWESVLKTQSWPSGAVPEGERREIKNA